MKMKKTIGSIESFTGGLFASEIVKTPHASTFYKGSVITYSSQLKNKLGIDTSQGVINKTTALAMASKGQQFLDVDYCVAFTGNAGPDAMENKPVGLVFIAINDLVYKLNFKGSRTEIRNQAVEFAMEKIKSILKSD